MINLNVKKLIFTGLTLGLVACGGGGSSTGGSDTSQNQNDDLDLNSESNLSEQVVITGAEDTVVEEVNEVVNATADLEVSEDFELQSISSLGISIDIPSLYGERAYVNICKPFSDGRTNYNDCMIRSPLENGQWQADLSVPHDVVNLKLEIWQYSTSEEPIVHFWENQNTDTQWRIES